MGIPFDMGYGYQWWIPAGDRREFGPTGVYNQFVYVDPSAATTIVKLWANRIDGTYEEESTNHDLETVAFLRSVARHAARLTAQVV